ncbi:MAG: hypothetical protein JWQ42_709, partial [Edaphobacter sp.]|nr:hypothetical protein [Edaphobacter sp.]
PASSSSLVINFAVQRTAQTTKFVRDLNAKVEQWETAGMSLQLQGFELEMRAGSLKVAAAFVSVVQRDAAMAEFSL